MSAGLTPFRIDVADSVLADLKARLTNARWPDELDGVGWDYGATLAAVKHLCTYWLNEFDWRSAEARLNEWPQFTTTIDGQNIHYAHVRSPHDGAFPLVVTHGWPGSIMEFQKIVGPLTNPTEHGGTASDAFHLVIPSIPGYGFSGPTVERGWNVVRVGQAWATLMARLGYERYGAQGGDWGAIITPNVAAADPDHVVGIHLNMVSARPLNPSDLMEGVRPEEADGVRYLGEFQEHETGYQAIQRTRPQTLAYGLTDSPVGLAGWILEKFRQWSDHDRSNPMGVFDAFTLDELCTNLTIYWVTGTINSSCRLYYESAGPGRRPPFPKVSAPTGCALFPFELYRPPRAWADKTYPNITQWTTMERGGHFAALEAPDLLVDDVRAFFRSIR